MKIERMRSPSRYLKELHQRTRFWLDVLYRLSSVYEIEDRALGFDSLLSPRPGQG